MRYLNILRIPPFTSQSDRCRTPLIFVETSKIPQPQGAAHRNLFRNIPLRCTFHCSFNPGFLQILKVLCTSRGSNKVERHCILVTILVLQHFPKIISQRLFVNFCIGLYFTLFIFRWGSGSFYLSECRVQIGFNQGKIPHYAS